MAALACGMIAVGSTNGDVTSTILQTLIERPESSLNDTYAKFLALGLGLTYLGEFGSVLVSSCGSLLWNGDCSYVVM